MSCEIGARTRESDSFADDMLANSYRYSYRYLALSRRRALTHSKSLAISSPVPTTMSATAVANTASRISMMRLRALAAARLRSGARLGSSSCRLGLMLHPICR
jgi:hypothetical protein